MFPHETFGATRQLAPPFAAASPHLVSAAMKRRSTSLLLCWLFALTFRVGRCQLQNVAAITDVSAMCSEEGISAQIMFDGPFYGKIYSARYANVHDCVYYNLLDMSMILFTIPNYKCGTRLSRNVDNLVERIENEVYVQFDKDTQTGDDRRYLFVCELASEPGRTLQPTQTIIVRYARDSLCERGGACRTDEPTRIVVTQSSRDSPEVTMQIQDGVGPFQSAVDRPLKLGDVITLVVKGQELAPGGDAYSMFVHSCFASDGGGVNKVQLIDRAGCTVRPQVAGQMHRTKLESGQVLYYFRMSAFKFPGPEDVYFACSVDLCLDCNFNKICPESGRLRRSTNADRVIHLHDYVKISDEAPILPQGYKMTRLEPHCFSLPVIAGVLSTLTCLLLALIVMTLYIISVTRCRRKAADAPTQQRKPANRFSRLFAAAHA